jgi:osmoprotectant transport system permease protein
MGMRGWQVLGEVELPLAVPIILGGIRNAAVGIVATAPLGALVASGGLGRFIVDGLARQETGRLAAGAALVALLSIIVEAAFAGVERWVAVREDGSRTVDDQIPMTNDQEAYRGARLT